MHHLVGLFDSYRVDLSQSHKLGQCSPNRFDRRLSLAFHLTAKPAPHPLIVPLVLFNPDRDPDALFVAYNKGNPIADISALEEVVVMKDGKIYKK